MIKLLTVVLECSVTLVRKFTIVMKSAGCSYYISSICIHCFNKLNNAPIIQFNNNYKDFEPFNKEMTTKYVLIDETTKGTGCIGETKSMKGWSTLVKEFT